MKTTQRVADAVHLAVSTLTALTLSGSLAVVVISPVTTDVRDLISPLDAAAAVPSAAATPLEELGAAVGPSELDAAEPLPYEDVGPPLPLHFLDVGPPVPPRLLDDRLAGLEIGEATWYGDQFHGRITASGEPMDQEAMIAAHLSHRFGTWLRVTNQENGLSVLVRVVDRGPHAPGRSMPAIIDLSRAAAREIDMLEMGRVVVTLEVVPAPTPAPVP
jgi:rare lipoprotein A